MVDGRTSLTKIASQLVAAAIATRHSSCITDLTVRAAFKGNKSGQAGGGHGGLIALRAHARTTFESIGLRYSNEECLVDFLVVRDDTLMVLLSVESEARPLATGADVHDLDKLLLVSSPWRIYIGRVNVTSTGKDHKVREAQQRTEQRFRLAVERGHVRPGEVFSLVLLRTGVIDKKNPTVGFYSAEWSTSTTDFSLREEERSLLDVLRPIATRN